jgi:carboxyl-terminal processing protease
MKRFIPALLLLAPLLAHGQTIDNKPEVRDEILGALATKIEGYAFVPGIDFTKWRGFLAKDRSKIDAAKNDEEFRNAVNSALRSFGFSHIMLATPKDVNTRQTGKTIGIGITSQAVEGGRQVVRVIPKGPAETAGLEPGDIITHVDDKLLIDTGMIAGADGTKLKLKVKKLNGKVIEYTITRRPFSTIIADTLTWINDKTAKLQIHTFDRAYSRKAIDALMLDAVKAKNLIVDLRFNGGGAVLNLFHLAGFFLDPSLNLGYMIDKTAQKTYEDKYFREAKSLSELIPYSNFQMLPMKTATKFTGNIVVLVNGGSGSASEIFAASLREQITKKSISEDGTITLKENAGSFSIVGAKSAGAVLVSTIGEAAHGFTIQYPLADYLTPGGTRLEGNPIVPDVLVEDAKIMLPGTPDKSVEAALAIFERERLRQERSKVGTQR